MLVKPDGADGVKEAQCAEAIDIGGVFCHLEGDLYVRLSAKIVDL